MRGRVLVWEPQRRSGMIIGEDHVSYMFFADSLSPAAVIIKGTHVDFVAENGVARGIVVRPEPAVKVRPAGGAAPPIPVRAPSEWRGDGEAASFDAPEPITLWGGFTRSLQLSFSGEGRASRTEFWGRCLFGLLFAICARVFDGLFGAYPVLSGLVFVFLLPSAISVNIRRFHDIGDSGWATLLLIVPLLNLFVWVILGSKPSEPTVNKYGPPASLQD